MNDWENISRLNERYGKTNMTGFKIITDQSPSDIIRAIRRDIEIFNNVNIDFKYVTRLIVGENAIDLCIRDNGTPITYYFSEESSSFREVVDELKVLCRKKRIPMVIH
ncbi:MAG: hypothetical protein IKE95_07735 [Methanobrevibacter sp.]|nr:hypothetical protein [Methanobrevibacter sp.]